MIAIPTFSCRDISRECAPSQVLILSNGESSNTDIEILNQFASLAQWNVTWSPVFRHLSISHVKFNHHWVWNIVAKIWVMLQARITMLVTCCSIMLTLTCIGKADVNCGEEKEVDHSFCHLWYCYVSLLDLCRSYQRKAQEPRISSLIRAGRAGRNPSAFRKGGYNNTEILFPSPWTLAIDSWQ